MKTIEKVAALIAFAALGLNVNAQKIDGAKVPAAVKSSFVKSFPGVTGVKWEKEKDNYEAGFKMGTKQMAALFEPSGTMKESEVVIKTSELPVSVLAYVKAHRKDAVIKEAAKITKANGEVNFEAEVKGKDMLFDTKGNFLKEVVD